ncbi:MAG: 2-C-methyl-D-erythritol 4-phosphate cytidylyltransferase [Deltaproteobacteria bacterium]|nr:2-C-methyl-D-erythritol 4-phosphate cytidylyltransferase [Deltaproteobacteria bacterium]
MDTLKGKNSPPPAALKIGAVIPAAGMGVRMGSRNPKQFLDLCGRPMLVVTLETFQNCPHIDGIILVVPVDKVDACRENIVQPYRLTKVTQVVAGGEKRQDSVKLGIEASEGIYERIMIHDGVRPLVPGSLIDRVAAEGRHHRAVIPALPSKETVKSVDDDGFVLKTHDRNRIWHVQTPQLFLYVDILAAHQQAVREGWETVTDDAFLLEKTGIPVKVIEGSEENIKITTPGDLELARLILNRSDAPPTGAQVT